MQCPKFLDYACKLKKALYVLPTTNIKCLTTHGFEILKFVYMLVCRMEPIVIVNCADDFSFVVSHEIVIEEASCTWSSLGHEFPFKETLL